jgi:putative DNA primase/helicase
LQWNHTPEVRIDLDPLHEAELPAILRWMIEGCLAWQEQGLNPPAEVVEAIMILYQLQH